MDAASTDDIRGLLVIASYSNSGAILVDIALRAANSVGLDERLQELLKSSSNETLGLSTSMPRTKPDEAINGRLFEAARVYYYL